MEFPDIPTSKSPRRELQGPRPAPPRIHKDSHRIKKPPLAPQPQPPPRQPVIIHTVSPKVIHTTPGDFMSLVQRLTGSSSASSSDTGSNVPFIGDHGDMVSPAEQFAAIEKARSPQPMKVPVQHQSREAGGYEEWTVEACDYVSWDFVPGTGCTVSDSR